uniref:Uncharacterized protein n=1 Tax=Caenorhabditis japonica TaxID=281687 RepID=A0A8R1DWW9_CAEJA
MYSGAVCYSQTLYRNTDGRWSDGRIASRRRVSTTTKNPKMTSPPVFFQRDSPSRVPHGALVYSSPRSSSKLNRSSYPSRNAPQHLEDSCCCGQHQCRSLRARSIAIGSTTSITRCRSPTPYDNQPEVLDVSSLMPESTSYDEALKSIGESEDVAMPMETINPIYVSPITTYNNPIVVEPHAIEENANEMDLTSSMDSRRSRADDADVESSTEDEEGNGNNILNTSMDSRSSNDDQQLRYRIDTSQSTMMSSLERSLELGAARSDGLSDNERRVKTVLNNIKTHRRSYSVSLKIGWIDSIRKWAGLHFPT